MEWEQTQDLRNRLLRTRNTKERLENLISKRFVLTLTLEGGLSLRFGLFYSFTIMAHILYVAFFILVLHGKLMQFWLFPIVLSIGWWFFSERKVLQSKRIRIIENEHQYGTLFKTITKLYTKAELSHTPRLGILYSIIPNAFAIGRTRGSSIIVITTALIDILNDEEMEGVLAHELSHIRNNDVSLMTWASIYAAVGILFIGWLSRYREFLADEQAGLLTRQPKHLATALLKISNIPYSESDLDEFDRVKALLIYSPGESKKYFSRLTEFHPPVQERVDRLMKLQLKLSVSNEGY